MKVRKRHYCEAKLKNTKKKITKKKPFLCFKHVTSPRKSEVWGECYLWHESYGSPGMSCLRKKSVTYGNIPSKDVKDSSLNAANALQLSGIN